MVLMRQTDGVKDVGDEASDCDYILLGRKLSEIEDTSHWIQNIWKPFSDFIYFGQINLL